VLKFYAASTGQPLLPGTVTVTASFGELSDAVDVEVTLAVAAAGDLVFNEILADGTVEGDPNGDDNLDSVEDEFLEIANASDVTVDLSGVKLVDSDWVYLPRHTFADGTILQAGQAIVVFGGGDTATLAADNVSFVLADNEDAGLQYGLNLSDGGETLTLRATDGTSITQVTYVGASDTSLTLSPDVWGTDYAEHTTVTTGVSFTPGTFADGSAFAGPDIRYAPTE